MVDDEVVVPFYPDRHGQGRAAVDGSALLAQLASSVRRFIVLKATEADAVALWILAVHGLDAYDVFPRLAALSAGPGAGKTMLRDLLARLVPRPDRRDESSAPAIYRSIDPVAPATLLLDEFDLYLPTNARLRNCLNSGHRRGGFVTLVERGVPTHFPTFAPVFIAGIGRLPSTIHSRSIVLRLKPRRLDEHLSPFDERDPAVTDPLDRMRHQAEGWTADQLGGLRKARPAMPAGFANRAADNWGPLFSCADAAGGEWPVRARQAAVEIEGRKRSTTSYDELADDLRTILSATTSTKISGEALVKTLVEMNETWAEFDRGRPLTKNRLAIMLGEVEVKSRSLRLGPKVRRGYHREDFDDFLSRYGAGAK